MLKSMTGFGNAEYQGEDYQISIEIKSVNHRYGDISIHLPKVFNALEDDLRKLVAKNLFRGKIDVFVSLEEHISRKKKIRVDKDLAIAYYGALKEISQTLDIPEPISVYEIAKYQDVLVLDEETLNIDIFKVSVIMTMQNALNQLLKMRLTEGQHIFEDLLSRINILENYVDAIEKRAPQVVEEYRERLTVKLNELLSDNSIEETRILQEILIFSDRVNVTEEIVRLKSHFNQFKTTIENANGSVGRKLDFIIQEMNRETNTIASKANDPTIAKIVVEVKSEIEKIREQVQNIE